MSIKRGSTVPTKYIPERDVAPAVVAAVPVVPVVPVVGGGGVASERRNTVITDDGHSSIPMQPGNEVDNGH